MIICTSLKKKKKKKRADKIPDKEEPPKKTVKCDAKDLMNWLLKKKYPRTGIISKTFQLSNTNCNTKDCRKIMN